MRVFLTSKLSEVEERQEVDALDILTSEYIIFLRESGIRISDLQSKKEILDFNFADLRKESSEEVAVKQD